MYEELVKRLRTQADAERYFTGEKMLYDEAAEAIEELSKPRWIPVTERLPGIDKEVIVLAYGNMMRIWSLHRLDNETADVCWECEDGTWDDAEAVTHWMPLPMPPEGET